MVDRLKTAVVAGGSAGVGYAVVERLLADGYQVAVLARGQTRLDEMATRFGPSVKTMSCDVSDAEAMMATAADIAAEWGAPEVWVNCAMLTAFSPFRDLTPDEFRAITETTYYGQVWGCRAALSIMEKGNIVNVGSGLSYRSVPMQSAYCGAKHAINGFTSSLRSELIREGRPIELSLVQLPAINTPQFDWARNRLEDQPQPAPPIYQPEVAAEAVMQAIANNQREVFVGTSVLQLVFGQMALPDALDRMLAGDAGVDAQKSGVPAQGTRAGNTFAPAEYPAQARGSFSDRARDRGVIVNADAARMLVFGGLVLAGFAAAAVMSSTRR